MVMHKAGKQMSTRMNVALWHHFLIRTAKVQIEHGYDIAMRSFHDFRDADSRGCCHADRVYGKAIKQRYFTTSSQKSIYFETFFLIKKPFPTQRV